MFHTTNTRIIFADSKEDAIKQYLNLNIKTEDPEAQLECYRAVEEEDFDVNAEFNLVGEVSLSPPVMETIRKDPDRAYVIYYLEKIMSHK
ncbi:MAG: hypothetical protein K6T65_07025 [Peptococcaceae bacterium]|nr:hypothetical protein [Peptococcaceae bacterium]